MLDFIFHLIKSIIQSLFISLYIWIDSIYLFTNQIKNKTPLKYFLLKLVINFSLSLISPIHQNPANFYPATSKCTSQSKKSART